MLYFQELKNSYRLLTGYIGTILAIVSVIFLLPLLILPAFPEEAGLFWLFLIPGVLSLLMGLLMRLSLKGIKQLSINVQQGGVIVLITWTIVIILSSLPFLLSGRLNFTHSIFEAVSGWTTTGLSVVDVESMPGIFLLWRSIMQFFGGAGLAILMLSTIIGPHGLGFYSAEGRSEKLLPNIIKSTKIIIAIYFSYAFVGVFLYMAAGMHWFDAINHSFAALSTGGFSTRSDSIGAYNNIYIEFVTLILMIAGATNFGAHFLILRGKVKEFFRISEVRFMIFLAVVFIPIMSFLALSATYSSTGDSLRIGVFQVISGLTTTGFSTVSYNNWSNFALFLLMLLMITGGSVGSTAGGIKLYRVYVLFKSLIWSIKRYFLPKNIVRENHVYTYEGKNYINRDKIAELSNYLVIYIIIYLSGVSVFLFKGYSLYESMFEFASAIGTVGLSLGITNASASNIILWTEITGMFLGRLEFFVIFFASIKIIRDIYFAMKLRPRSNN